MEKKLNIGDDVLIFRYIHQWGIHQNIERFIRGNVIKIEMSDDLSYHGSSWYVMNYKVLGEDGKEYFGNYMHPTLGDSFFMTEEDYILYLERMIAKNQNQILEINKENNRIQKMIEKVQKREENQEISHLIKTKKME